MKKNGLTLIIGGLIGIIVGLLIAPRKGTETREILSEKIEELKDKSEKIEIKKKIEAFVGEYIKEKDEIIKPEEEIVISREFKDEEEFGTYGS